MDTIDMSLCGADDSSTSCESVVYPLAFTLEARDLCFDTQMVCELYSKLVRLQVFEQIDELFIQVAPDAPHSDMAALGLTDLRGDGA